MNHLKYTWDHHLTSQRCITWSHTQSATASTSIWQSIQVTRMVFDAYMACHMVSQFISQVDSRIGYIGHATGYGLYRSPLDFTTGRLWIAFLIILNKYLYPACKWNRLMVLFYIHDSLFICIFLSMGMHVSPIFWARDVRSLCDFRRWIPGKTSHMAQLVQRWFL